MSWVGNLGAGSEQRGTRGLRCRRKRLDPDGDEPDLPEQPRDVGAVESEPDVAHLVPVLVPVVLEEVDDQQPTARDERAGRLVHRGPWIGEVNERETDDRRVERGVVD